MRALRFSEFGDVSKLSLMELPEPRADDRTVIVRVLAAPINPSDIKTVAGRLENTTVPRVPGRAFSGIVESGPPEWRGVEVWGAAGETGLTVDGSHAERLAFPVVGLIRKPANLTHEATAVIGIDFLIAWLGLVRDAAAQAGETVVVVGASGHVGGAVTQLARARGCRVIGASRGARVASSNGAMVDEWVDANGDFAADVRTLTGGKGAAVVFDAVGGVTFERSCRSLARRGRLVAVSSTGLRRVELDLVEFYHHELRLIGADSRPLAVGAAAEILSSLVPAFEQGTLRPPTVAQQFPLAKAIDAYRLVASGAADRVVVTPSALT